MHSLRYSAVWLLLLVLALAFVPDSSETSAQLQRQTAAPANAREDAYRANNIGVALLEQFKYKEGADEFRRALQLDAKLALAHINLCIALYHLPHLPAAQREAPAAPAPAPAARAGPPPASASPRPPRPRRRGGGGGALRLLPTCVATRSRRCRRKRQSGP